MIQRGEGQPSWPLSPYEVSVSYGQPGAAGQGADWFGPLAPITPLAPPQVSGRQWDYPSGYNLATTPRIYEPVSFHTLRGLAEGYDLLRLVIETRKDQVARLVWNIGPRNKQPGADPRLATLRQFFTRPDGLHTFGDWLRLLLEELFVIDAPTLYLQRDRGGRLTALLPLDGATIKPVIDDWGRTPQPYVENGETVYPIAYQQVLKGYPAVNYSLRDIIYRPRNIRVNHAYGLSPVEQVITSVNIALRRQMYLLDYFTQGNIPDSLIGVPENWTPDQIASYQKYWDAYFDGDLGRRRRAKFVPGGVAKTFIQTKEPDLKGPFDEWLARIVCFAFSISPQALTQQMNRATAQTQKEMSEEEGLAPVLAWVKDLIDQVIAQEFDAPDLEFAWSAEPSIDPQAQEAILSSYTSKGIITINEARAALGRDPFPDAAANKPMTLTGQGYVPLGQPGQGASKDVRSSDLTLDKAFDWIEDLHPRWPQGTADSQGGQFAPKDEGAAAIIPVAARRRYPKRQPPVDHSSKSPSEPQRGIGDNSEKYQNLPELPEDEPPPGERYTVVKQIGQAIEEALEAGATLWVRNLIGGLVTIAWLNDRATNYYYQLKANADPPKTLQELQDGVATPTLGYEIHHIVELKPGLDAGFSEDLLNSRENLVEIPEMKHQQISNWYQSPDADYTIDGRSISPREYLSDKSWQERYEFGIQVLKDFGVLKK